MVTTVKPKSRSRRRSGELRRRDQLERMREFTLEQVDPRWFRSQRRSLMDLMMLRNMKRREVAAERAEIIREARAKRLASAQKTKPGMFARALDRIKSVMQSLKGRQ